jgi:hypothetical protein
MEQFNKLDTTQRRNKAFFQQVFDLLSPAEQVAYEIRSPGQILEAFPTLAFWGILGTNPLGPRVSAAFNAGNIGRFGFGAQEGWPLKFNRLPEFDGHPEYILGMGEIPEDHPDALTPEKAVIEALTSVEITREHLERFLLAVDAERKGVNRFLVKGAYEALDIELGENTVKVNDRRLRQNFFGLGKLTLAQRQDSIWHQAYILIGQAIVRGTRAGSGSKQMTALLFRDLPNAWVGENWYAENQVSQARELHKLAFIKPSPAWRGQLNLVENKDRLALVEPMKAILAEKIAVAPHHQGRYLVVGAGALAMGLGFSNGKLTVSIYANKESKVFNRLKSTAAHACCSADSVESPLRMADGLAMRGRRYTVAVVWSPLVNHGDGVILLRQGETIPTIGKKTLEIKVESPTGLKGEAAIAETRKRLQIKREVDWCKPALILDGRPMLNWPVAHKASVILAESSVTWDDNTQGVVVAVTYQWESHATREKLNGFNVKGTTLSAEVGMQDQPQLILPPNAVKGVCAFWSIWACTLAGGLIIGNDGLSAETVASFDAWRNSQTRLEPISQVIEDPESYGLFKKLYRGNPKWNFHEDGKTITHNAQVLRGEIVLATEASSTIEWVGESNLYPEMLFGVAAVSKEFAQHLWGEAGDVRQRAILKLAEAVKGEGQLEDINLSDLHSAGATTKLVIKELAERYPKTVRLNAANESVCLNFRSLLILENWLPGESTRGPSNILAEIARLQDADEHEYGADKVRQIRGLQKLMLAPGQGLASTLRSGTVKSRKVNSSFFVPRGEVWMHPDDPAVQSAQYKDGGYYLFGRMPMVKFFGGTVKLDTRAPIGCFLVNAIDWVLANCGDVDGDSALSIRVPDAFIQSVKQGLEHSVFGMDGYFQVFGKHKWVDDLFTCKEEKGPASSFWDGYRFMEVDPETWVETYENTVKHYHLLGLGYGVAARLLFSYIHRSQMKMAEAEETGQACVYAWLSLYEDLGLSGYSQDGYAKLVALESLAKTWNKEPANRSEVVQAVMHIFDDGETVINRDIAEKVVRAAANHVLARGLQVAETAEQKLAALMAFARHASKGRLHPVVNLVSPSVVRQFKGSLFGSVLEMAHECHQAVFPVFSERQEKSDEPI